MTSSGSSQGTSPASRRKRSKRPISAPARTARRRMEDEAGGPLYERSPTWKHRHAEAARITRTWRRDEFGPDARKSPAERTRRGWSSIPEDDLFARCQWGMLPERSSEQRLRGLVPHEREPEAGP